MSGNFEKYSYSRLELRGRVVGINKPTVNKANGKKMLHFSMAWEAIQNTKPWNILQCNYQGDKRADMFYKMVQKGDWLYLWGRFDQDEEGKFEMSVWSWAYDMMMDKRFHAYEKKPSFKPKQDYSRGD